MQAGGEVARSGHAFAVVGECASGEAGVFARMRGEDAGRWQFGLQRRVGGEQVERVGVPDHRAVAVAVGNFMQ